MVLAENFPQILDAARGGSEAAWASMYRDLSPAVLGYLRARGANDPEDLTGEVFLQVVRDLPKFDGGERDFRSWVFVIAHNRLIDDKRRRARRPAESTSDIYAEEGSSPDAHDEALHQVAADRVHSILRELSPDQQAVVLLRVLGQLTIEEVANVVGKSPGAVKALQRRGLRTVARAFAKDGVPL